MDPQTLQRVLAQVAEQNKRLLVVPPPSSTQTAHPGAELTVGLLLLLAGSVSGGPWSHD